MANKRQTTKTVASVDEMIRQYLPKLHEERSGRNRLESDESRGTGLASEFICDFKQALGKRTKSRRTVRRRQK